jgi:replicative DNA helicase
MDTTAVSPNGTSPHVSVGDDRSRPAPPLLPLGALLREWEDFATDVHDARVRGIARGPVSGLALLDRELGGVLEPGLHVVHGTPGVGKTAFALQVAATCGTPCLYVTCEMRPVELLARITARATETYLGRLKSGELTPADSLAKVKEAIRQVPQLGIVDATEVHLPTDLMREYADTVRGDGRHVLIVIDSVHSWAAAGPSVLDEYERLNEALASLRIVAGRLGCPVLAVAERNRASMKGGGLNASAGSRKFEYAAQSVFDLSEPEDEKGGAGAGVPLAADEKPVDLRVVKNRAGAAGKRLRLAFHGALQRYTEAGA